MIRILINDCCLDEATELLDYLIYDFDGYGRIMIIEDNWLEAEALLEDAGIDYDII